MVAEDCRRCEDDSVVDRPGSLSSAVKRRCVICGLPAVKEVDGRWFCQRHYVLAVARQV